MISVADALALIVQNRADYSEISVPLSNALGGIAASDITALLTHPPLAASAMDGYAVKLADVRKAGALLKVIGESPAGTPFTDTISPGEAVRIFTGGALPEGADHIVIQENVNVDGDTISVQTANDVARHIRQAGIDFIKGDTLITKDKQIGPADIALAAAGNHARLPIRRRSKVAIIANGDELRPPGSKLKTGQIVSSNSAALSALIRNWGADALDMGIASDSLESIRVLIEAAKDADIIVPVGGASVGDYDYMRTAFSEAGFTKIFEKIAVKPGKPTWFGRLGQQRVLGLPGNPASALVCAYLFLKPLLGLGDHKFISVPLASNLAANGSRETYQRGRVGFGETGLTVQPFPKQDSSLITPFSQSNVLIRLAANSGPWQAGDKIDILPLGSGPDVLSAIL